MRLEIITRYSLPCIRIFDDAGMPCATLSYFPKGGKPHPNNTTIILPDDWREKADTLAKEAFQ